MMTKSTLLLSRLKKKFLLIQLGRTLLYSAAAACIGIGVAILIFPESWAKITLPLLAFAATAFTFVIRQRLHHRQDARLASFINNRCAAMEDSADLLFADTNTLNRLQRLQQSIVETRFSSLYPDVAIPHRLWPAIALLLASVILVAAASLVVRRSSSEDIAQQNITPHAVSRPQLPVEIESMVINVSPPAYTQMKAFTSPDAALEIAEGSRVTWNVKFSDSVARALLVFSNSDTAALTPTPDGYSLARTFHQNDHYHIVWQSESSTQTTDFFSIRVSPDEEPQINVAEPAQSTRLSIGARYRVALACTISDDYGLSDSYIIATVSKGSGESVKFREEKLFFNSPPRISGKRLNASTIIDIRELGLEPGDELYFYIEAWDVKRPTRNRSRTETFFISLVDTASQVLSVEGGLGVDIMPEYFRSQRQIIIDTEQLLRERRAITNETFKERSNAIAHDQKVLRLRYGQFLGEEFEETIGPTAEEQMLEENADEHAAEADDVDHEGEDGEQEDPAAEYTHVHDDPEEATFFTQAIRAKLKAALSEMWKAELHLRLSSPTKSLPFQYEALRILKEITQDSRVYVHRTGFDPPPIKEEKRLTGDLSEIEGSRQTTHISSTSSYPAIRQALTAVELALDQPAPALNESAKKMLAAAGTELSRLAVERPGQYLRALTQIKELTSSSIPDVDFRSSLLSLRSTFWEVLPSETPDPAGLSRPSHALDRIFVEKLDALQDE